MTRKVLGNDPFRRGASPQNQVSSRRRKRPQKSTPELQLPQMQESSSTPSPAVSPRPHAHAPDGALLGELPISHPSAPSLIPDLQPHPQLPTAFLRTGEPRAHPSSPSVSFDVTPHSASPQPIAPQNLPQPHGGSPQVPFDAVIHSTSPRLVEHHGPDASHASAAPHTPSASFPAPSGDSEPPRIQHSPGGTLRELLRAFRLPGRPRSGGSRVDRWGKDGSLGARLRPFADLLYSKYWRLHIEGIEQLPQGGCILVANRAQPVPFDGLVLQLALRRERPDLEDARWLLESHVFDSPFLAPLATGLGAVRASPDNALRALAEHRPLIVFPEGFHRPQKPSPDRPHLARFGRGGYVKIALRAKVPVFPVAVCGSDDAVPLLGTISSKVFGGQLLPPLPGRWSLRFGPAVDLTGGPTNPDDDLPWVEETNRRVRENLERMLADLKQQG